MSMREFANFVRKTSQHWMNYLEDTRNTGSPLVSHTGTNSALSYVQRHLRNIHSLTN